MDDYIGRKAALVLVGFGCNPYDEIGNYIKNHITVAEDIIATIEIDGRITNELFMVEIKDDLDFVWKSDWWEGENDVKLIDFFPVSEAVRDKELPSADVQQVVRCKDCKFGRYDIGDRGMYCGRKNVQLDTYEDDFCSFGERKDGEQDG